MNRKGKRMNVVKAFCLFTLLGCFIGCKDDEKKKEQSFNNDLPIEIVGLNLKKLLRARNSLSMEKISEMTPL